MSNIMPTAPTPPIIMMPDQKEYSQKDSDDNAFRTQTKATNFGLEIFKFMSQAQVAWYSFDSETGGKATPGYQGVLAQNSAWWTDSRHFMLDESVWVDQNGKVVPRDFLKGKTEAELQLLKKAGVIVQVAGKKILQLDSETTNPLDVLKEGQGWHDPGGQPGEFFGRQHAASPLFDGGVYEGSNYGRLKNVNPFAGLAGGYAEAGYADPKYEKNNTWNHFDVNESHKNDWDYNVSSGYQSVSALDNLGDWGTMNATLDEISKDAIIMKNNHYGYTTASGSFHNQEGHGVAEGNWEAWQQDTSSQQYTGFGALSTHADKPGKTVTQAPNYFEILNSGAFANWKTDANSISKTNIDGKKFYFYCKGMLESKRRLLETFRHLFGKTNELASTGNETLSVSRNQCAKIKEWYSNVTNKNYFNNGFYDLLFFQTAHSTFNMLENICSGGEDAYTWTSRPEFGTFKTMAVYGAYKWMIDPTNTQNINTLRTGIGTDLQPIIAAKGTPVSDSDKNLQAIANSVQQDALPNINTDSVETIRIKLSKIAINLQTLFQGTTNTNYKKKVLSYMNELAPISEFFRKGSDEDVKTDATQDISAFKMPIADFASYKTAAEPGINDIEFDTVPHSAYSSGVNTKSYDGWAQLGGYGMSWYGKGLRRTGLSSLSRFNPVISNADYTKAAAGIDRTKANFKYLSDNINVSGLSTTKNDEFDFHLTPDGGLGVATSAYPEWLLSKNISQNIWASDKGTYHFDKVSNTTTGRGALREIDENPVFAAASYYFGSRENRKSDILTAGALTFYNIQESRRKNAEFELKTEDYENTLLEEMRLEQEIQQKALEEEKRFEMIMEAEANRRRAEERQSQNKG